MFSSSMELEYQHLEEERTRKEKGKGVEKGKALFIYRYQERKRERGDSAEIERERERERRELIIVSGFYIIGTCCNGNLSVHVLHDHQHFKGKEQFFTYNDLKPMNCKRRREN